MTSLSTVAEDLPLHAQALHPRLDQAGAPLVEEQDAEDQHREAGEVEHDDASRQAREHREGEETLNRPPYLPQLAAKSGGQRRGGAPGTGAGGLVVRQLLTGCRHYCSLNRYPTPYSVSIISKSSSTALNFFRSRLMWLSMVRSST